MEFFKKMDVYKKVPRDVARKMGCKVITTKRVNTKKVDTSRPKLSKQPRWSRGEVRQKTRSLFGDSTTGDAQVLVFHVCERPDRARAVSPCRHRHRTCIFLRACPKTDLDRNSQRGFGSGDEGCVGQLHSSLHGSATLRIRPDVPT